MISKKLSPIALILFCTAFASVANSVSADEQQYLSADAFIEQSFEGVKPNWKMLTLDSALKSQAKQILGHEYAGSRVRYWQAGTKTVWILEEIGKEKPITLGIAVNQNHIDTIQVLVYRETRGGEVAQASFLQQFKAALLQADNKLNKPIDSIAGATLSVHAVTNASRLALLFSQHVTASN